LPEYGRTSEKSFPLTFCLANKSLGEDFSFSKSFQALTSNLGYLQENQSSPPNN
jgi:hypothetical protein